MNVRIDVSNVILKTDRLILRPWRLDDFDDFYEYAKVEGVGQMAGWLPHQSKDESKMILNAFITHKKTFAIEYNGNVIGSIGIEEYNEENYPGFKALLGREIGYVLAKPYWGRGLMPEAVKEVIKYLFEVEKLDFIIVGHFTWNTQSARVVEKLGFKYIKTIKYQTKYETVEDSIESILYNPNK